MQSPLQENLRNRIYAVQQPYFNLLIQPVFIIWTVRVKTHDSVLIYRFFFVPTDFFTAPAPAAVVAAAVPAVTPC